MNIVHLLICLPFILYHTSGLSLDWTFARNNSANFIHTIDSMEGTSFLYNCEIQVAKIPSKNKYIYWVSIWDKVRGNTVSLSFKSKENTEVHNEQPNYFFSLERSTQNYQKNLVELLQLHFDFNGNLANLRYVNFYTNPFQALNTIKCSGEL
jgi:hypothetical protein